MSVEGAASKPPPPPSPTSLASVARASAKASFFRLLWWHRHLRLADRTSSLIAVATSGGQSAAGSASCFASISAKSSSKASSHLWKMLRGERPLSATSRVMPSAQPSVTAAVAGLGPWTSGLAGCKQG